MKEIIKVKENYSLIINERNIKKPIEDDRYKAIKEETFNKLFQFLNEYDEYNSETDALDFMSLKLKKRVGYTISLKNYVGVIQMKDGSQIQIMPKISFEKNSEDNEIKTKKIMYKMLRTLKEFEHKSFNMADIELYKMNLYETFINMYLQELIDVVRHGIKSLYINQSRNIQTVKGKILMSKHITENIIHKEKFYCEYDEYIIDTPENRIIKTTLLKLLKISNSNDNIRKINQLLTYFELVGESTNYDLDFSKVIINKSNKHYDLIIKWSKIILKDKSFTNFSGENQTRALLFPMEKLFESYVAKLVKHNINNQYQVIAQNKSRYLFNEPSKKFALKPDIIIKNNDKVVAILDTKWKNLDNNERLNYGISQADMYQMYAYAKKYKTNNIWLLYPLNDEMRNHDQINFKSDDGVEVNVFFINLENEKIDNNIKELICKVLEKNN